MREMYRRMLFNVLARNQDDHTRNVAFLMDPQGRWTLSPAFDITWSFNPAGKWANRHQMSVNGKRDDFTQGDLLATAEQMGIRGAPALIEQVAAAVSRWARHAEEAGVDPEMKRTIGRSHRLDLAKRHSTPRGVRRTG